MNTHIKKILKDSWSITLLSKTTETNTFTDALCENVVKKTLHEVMQLVDDKDTCDIIKKHFEI
jgi:hypothetical protein